MTEAAQPSTKFLTGQLLVAMPGMPDPRFAHSVIYMCAHSDDGAMGLIVNRIVDSLDFSELLTQVGVEEDQIARNLPVHYGGPVETGRGFVLHSREYRHEGTISVDDHIGLTASVDVLREVARGGGPKACLLALGYAGWGAGQIELEMQQNGWLHVPADDNLVFGEDIDDKWRQAIQKIGIDPNMLSSSSGRA
jgi:putative transcriptional regulator